MRYVVAKADGSINVLKRTAPLALKELQKLVGGYIEEISIIGGSLRVKAMVNEDGRRLRLPPNTVLPGLLGNAVLGKVKSGEFVGRSEEEAKAVKVRLQRAS